MNYEDMKQQETVGSIFLKMLTNPIFLIVYFIAWRVLWSICQVGGLKRRMPILLACGFFFMAWLVWFIIRVLNRKNAKIRKQVMPKGVLVIWYIVGIILIIGITVVFSKKIYDSAQSYNGKLSWKVEEVKNKREITFTHNNVLEDGVIGIFTDIKEKEEMPEDLFLATDFTLLFDKDGTITSFDTMVYGKMKDGSDQSFLISYNENTSDKITVYLNGYTDMEYLESDKMEPLFTTMEVVPLQEAVNTLCGYGDSDISQYEIYYDGMQNIGYDDGTLIYINPQGERAKYGDTPYVDQVVNYSVDISVTGVEPNTMTIERYILVDDIDLDYIIENNEKMAAIYSPEKGEEAKEQAEVDSRTTGTYRDLDDGTEEFFLTDTIGYRLVIVDAAAGSRAYKLEKTTDGTSWTTLNEDPFNGAIGVAAGIDFTDEDNGTITLSHSGGAYAEDYVTTDGGKSFTMVE